MFPSASAHLQTSAADHAAAAAAAAQQQQQQRQPPHLAPRKSVVPHPENPVAAGGSRKQQHQQPDLYAEFSEFLVPDFDANEYAKSCIRKQEPPRGNRAGGPRGRGRGRAEGAAERSGEEGKAEGGAEKRDGDENEPDGEDGEDEQPLVRPRMAAGGADDIAGSLARLSFSIDNLNKQVREQVASQLDGLLRQVSGVRNLEPVLSTVQQNVEGLNVAIHSLRTEIRVPYNQIKDSTQQLERIHDVSETLRHLLRFLQLARRLDGQLLGGERELPKAAVTLRELDILEEADLTGIEAAHSELERVSSARERVIGEGDRLLRSGMLTRNEVEIAAGLQVHHCLGLLQQDVQSAVQEIMLRVPQTDAALGAGTLREQVVAIEGRRTTDGACDPTASHRRRPAESQHAPGREAQTGLLSRLLAIGRRGL